MTRKNPEMNKLLSNAARDISGAFAARFCALGIELGLFKAIAETDGLTSAELSQVTGFNERYVREWVHVSMFIPYAFTLFHNHQELRRGKPWMI